MVDLYNRQIPLQLNIPYTVTVVGCGGIGSWVAILSAMSGVSNLVLLDPDELEESNRNRLPFCSGSIGRKKVHVVSEYIQAIRPECNVAAIPEKLEGVLVDIVLGTTSVLVECTDSPRSQIRLYTECKRKGTRFIRAGYDGTKITVTGTVSGWIKDEESVDYTTAPSWAVPAVTVAALAVGRMMKWLYQEVNLDLCEIGVPVVNKQNRPGFRCGQNVSR